MFMLGVDYEPTDQQKRWHEGVSKHKRSRGSGWSTFVVMDALMSAVENDGSNVLIVSATPGHVDYLIDTFRRRVSPELYEYSAARRVVTLKNGSRIEFKHRMSLDPRGLNIDAVYFDETPEDMAMVNRALERSKS